MNNFLPLGKTREQWTFRFPAAFAHVRVLPHLGTSPTVLVIVNVLCIPPPPKTQVFKIVSAENNFESWSKSAVIIWYH